MVGQQIGRYQVVRVLGHGGMGLVYEAVDKEIERRVAIKVLKAQFFGNEDVAARFVNEARAVNIIQHPSVVSAFELGHLPDGSAYIVMEYLDGETLQKRLQRLGRLDDEAIRIARQICSALCAAHAKHIVHRDLKPANIMLVADPDMMGGERVKVLDFGLAKLAESHGKGQPSTRTGMIMGSPGYMSPEQSRNPKAVDERTDVYALGVILYEMLAGKPPFVSPSNAEVMAMHTYAQPPELHEVAPDVSPEVAGFVHRMLGKQPQERPSSQEVLRFLNQQAGLPMMASMPHPIIKAPDKAPEPVQSPAAALAVPASHDGATHYGSPQQAPPKAPAPLLAPPGPVTTQQAPLEAAAPPLPPQNEASAPRRAAKRSLRLGVVAFLILGVVASGFLWRRLRPARQVPAPVLVPSAPNRTPPSADVLPAASQKPLDDTATSKPPSGDEQRPARGGGKEKRRKRKSKHAEREASE